MEIIKIKERLERDLKALNESISVYETSDNNELRIASRTLKFESERITILVEALEKRVPMKATYVYDDEFVCPACNYEDDGYDVRTLKFCPECGQTLEWETGVVES